MCRSLERGWRRTGRRSESVRKVANRCNYDRNDLSAIEFSPRRANAEHAVLPILLLIILENFSLNGGIIRDRRLANKRRASGGPDPYQDRASTLDAFGLPG